MVLGGRGSSPPSNALAKEGVKPLAGACSINTNGKRHLPLKIAQIKVTLLHLSLLSSACFGAGQRCRLKINTYLSAWRLSQP